MRQTVRRSCMPCERTRWFLLSLSVSFEPLWIEPVSRSHVYRHAATVHVVCFEKPGNLTFATACPLCASRFWILSATFRDSKQ
eukprot:6467257-Amphidinium_carterae.1